MRFQTKRAIISYLVLLQVFRSADCRYLNMAMNVQTIKQLYYGTDRNHRPYKWFFPSYNHPRSQAHVMLLRSQELAVSATPVVCT